MHLLFENCGFFQDAPDNRIRLTAWADGHPDPLVVEVSRPSALGRPFVQLGSRRIVDEPQIGRLVAALVATAERFFSESWPSPSTE